METNYKRSFTMSTAKINECRFFLERLRLLRGTLNKAEFSRKLGISAQTYQHYEDGRIPRSDIISDIAQRCGVTVDWLLGRSPGGEVGAPAPAPDPRAVREPPAPYGHPPDPCHYPGTLPAEVAAIRERLASIERSTEHMSAQLETVTALLSGALRSGIEQPAATPRRKAG